MRLALIALVSALLIAPGIAWADDCDSKKDEQTKVERSDATPDVVAKATEKTRKTQRRRLTTAERWRGKPYLRSSENQALRAQALGRALPIDRPGVGPVVIRSNEAEPLRRQALDMVLPLRAPMGGL